jgi:protoheme IX farnesyltransferase
VLVWLTRVGVAALLLVVGSGAVTGAASAALPCSSWPLCVEGGLLPDQPSVEVWLHMGHRLLTIVATLVMFAIVYRIWSRPSPRLTRRLALLLAAVLIVQILLGGNLVVAGGPVWLGLLHLAAGLALWLLAIALAIVAPRTAEQPRPAREALPSAGEYGGRIEPVNRLEVSGPSSAAVLPALATPLPLTLPNPRAVRALVADYVALMKPGILTLLLVTTFAAMLIATAGLPPFALICITIAGGVLIAGGANVLNCYIDRDIDAQMARTRHRASASHRVPPSSVLGFGIGLTGAAVLLLGVGANWVAALLALAGNLYYVLVYTLWLKRRTPQNVVIGGAAGAVPPLVGWAAVTGDLSPIAWMLFAIIFMWTPPHSWALALLKQGEYGRAAVPMLPVVAGEAATRRQIVIYTVLLVLVCLALVPLGLGPVYLAAAVIINAVFLGLALQLYWRPSKRHARRLFFGSLWYLALIFLAAVADRLILG